MTGMVSHPVAGVISDSSALSNYCMSALAPFDVFVRPMETSKRVKCIEPHMGNRGETSRACCEYVIMDTDVVTVSSTCSLISCDDQVYDISMDLETAACFRLTFNLKRGHSKRIYMTGGNCHP